MDWKFSTFLTNSCSTSGPQAYQQFMSPFQQDVIDTTLQEFDVQAAKGIGNSRSSYKVLEHLVVVEKVYKEQNYRSTSDRNRAALQAQLLQQGFGQAQQAAQQAFAQQQLLSQQQQATHYHHN